MSTISSTSATTSGHLVEVERLLHSRRVRLAGRAMAWLRTRRQAFPGTKPADFEALMSDPNPSATRLADGVRAARGAGALETVATFMERADSQLATLSPATPASTLVPLLDAWLLIGQRSRAELVAGAHRKCLMVDAAGASRCELLLGPSGPWLPDGRPNLLGLSRSVARDGLSFADLHRLLGSGATQWLRYPELRLLYCSALWREDPARSLSCLNRFLEVEGVPSWMEIDAGSPTDFLSSIRGVCRRRTGGPRVSVVIAAHNAEATLGYSIESLLAQSHSELEVLVGDDASTDATFEVMREFRRDPRVRLFRSERNQGAYNLRNALAANARGQFVTFHDADDFALPSRIHQQVTVIRKSGAQAVVANLLRVDREANFLFSKEQRASRLSRVSLLLRRDTFAALRGFRPARVGADEEFHAQLQLRFGVAALARLRAPVMLSLAHRGSATSAPNTEASNDGYRSPSRRAYSELIFRHYVRGEALSDTDFEKCLVETENWVSPCDAVEAG